MVEVEAEEKIAPAVARKNGQWNQGQGGWDTDERGFKYWRLK